MKEVKLLKEYQDYSRGEIIEVSNNVAFGLVDSGIARNVITGDFIKKVSMGRTKAFEKAPSTKSYKRIVS